MIPKLKCPNCGAEIAQICEQCGHIWTPRVFPVTLCPSCKSKRWNEPKKAESPEER